MPKQHQVSTSCMGRALRSLLCPWSFEQLLAKQAVRLPAR